MIVKHENRIRALEAQVAISKTSPVPPLEPTHPTVEDEGPIGDGLGVVVTPTDNLASDEV